MGITRQTTVFIGMLGFAACTKAAPNEGATSSQSARAVAAPLAAPLVMSVATANSRSASSLRTHPTSPPLIPFSPLLDADKNATAIVAGMWQDFGIRKIILDTGSPYFLVPRNVEEPAKPCAKEHSLQFIQGGSATYCPGTSALDLVDDEGNPSPLASEPIVAGEATFTDTPVKGILGLACNITGDSQADMIPTVFEIEPAAFSFAFPDGVNEPGYFTQGPLSGTYAKKQEVSLRDASASLGFGYVARIVKIEFKSGDDVVLTLTNDLQSPDVTKQFVWMKVGDAEKKALQATATLAAFIDTGFGPPISLRRGTVSLFGSEVASGRIPGDSGAGTFDSFAVTFEGTDANDIVLESGDLSGYSGAGFSRDLFEYEILLNSLQIYVVLGLNFLAQWDLEFGFENGRCAKSLTFAEREP